MKKSLIFSNKRALFSFILVLAMLVGLFQGTFTVSALTVPEETVSSWEMTSSLSTGGVFSQQWYAMVNDPADAKNSLVLGINARSNQHNHASLGRPMVFNNGIAEDDTYTVVALKAGKYTVDFKYYLKVLTEGFYAPKDTDGNAVICETCNNDIKAYNDGTSASDYEIYFGVVAADYNVATSKLVSKSNALFSYETAKSIDFEKYGWQNGTVSFVVTDEMVTNNSNIFAMYRKAVGHAVYLKDISLKKCSSPIFADEVGLISDFTKADVLPATDSSSLQAGAMSVNNATNSIYNNSNRFVADEVEIPGAGTQSVMAITFNNNKRATCFTTGLDAKDFISLKSGTKYQISFDFYNPNYSLYDNTLNPMLNLTDLSNENPIVSDGTIAKGMVTLLTGNEIFSDIAANGYVRIVKEFEVASDKTVNHLGLYTYCQNNTVLKPYYIDNIEIVEVKNTVVFDFGNRNVKTDNITVTYGDSFTAPENDETISKAGNISGWCNLTTGEFVALGEMVSKAKAAKYVGETTVFVAEYNNEIIFDFNSNKPLTDNKIPNNISGTAARLITDEDANNKYIEFTQIGNDRHFLLYTQNNSDTVTALASYEKFKTYEITFDYKCTAFGTSKPKIYAAMGVQYYAGGTQNALYKANILDVTNTTDDWQKVTAYIMAPNGYEVNTAEGAKAFQDGKYIGLGITGLLEGETGATVLFDNVTVKSVDFMLGDVSGNGIINATDLASLRSHIMGEKELYDITNADVKKDGTINAADIVRLKKYLVASM